MSSNGIHSAGVWAALRGSAAIPSWASRARPVCRMAATMAPTIGAVTYSHASLKLPVATIGPSARAGLKGAPVRAPPIRMLKVSVIPIASGARLPARPATAVLSTTVTRKKASTASIMKPASGDTANELADDVADRLAGTHRAGGEHADSDGWVHMAARCGAVGEGEGHDGQAVGERNRDDTGQADTIADHSRRAGADKHEREGADEFRKELGR